MYERPYGALVWTIKDQSERQYLVRNKSSVVVERKIGQGVALQMQVRKEYRKSGGLDWVWLGWGLLRGGCGQNTRTEN